MSGLLAFDEALARIVASVEAPTEAERVPIEACAGRTLAEAIVASRAQPPFAASAMDGYAVRAEDLAPGAPLVVVGESAAGRRFSRALQPREAVRIFTGAPLPEGADTILIQENATQADGVVIPTQIERRGRFVRAAGMDFVEGDAFFAPGRRLRATDMALAAALGADSAMARRPPRVAILATGDELVPPGARPGPDQIVASTHLSVAAIVSAAGGEPRALGIARDDLGALGDAIAQAQDWRADILVTTGGASVGDHDLVQPALTAVGMSLSFWRIAMRPGKPLLFGRLGAMRVLGLPGNPASAVVCAHLFLRPLLDAFLGRPPSTTDRTGRLGRDLPANDHRQDYLRSTLALGEDGGAVLTPLPAQDSSMTSVLAQADALVVRPPNAAAARAGDPCSFMLLE